MSTFWLLLAQSFLVMCGLAIFMWVLKGVIRDAVLEALNEWEFELKLKSTSDPAESAFKK